MRAAGGIKKYEHSHLNDIAAIFVPKFAYRSLPPEMVRRVVEYAFHVGVPRTVNGTGHAPLRALTGR